MARVARGTPWHVARGAEDQVRAEAETLRSMHHANLHRVVESFEDAAGLKSNHVVHHERNEVERIYILAMEWS